MEQDYRLAEGEYRFACLVWANEPLGSGQLVALANEALGWKKSTTYTVLKKLCERGILHNANGTVTALVKQAQVQQEEGPEGLAVERRGRRSTGRPKKLPSKVEADLLAEVQRLRAENAYLKNLQALVLEEERRQHKKRR